MLTFSLTALIVAIALVVVWLGFHRSRAVQQVSGYLTGPVDQMKEQLLLTADSAIDRLDSKIAQMEILLAEIDRRSTLLAQQSQRQQLTQTQLEQQQQALTVWVQQQRRQFEQDFALRQQLMPKVQVVESPVVTVAPALKTVAPVELETIVQAEEKSIKKITSTRAGKKAKVSEKQETVLPDKRTQILELAEQGISGQRYRATDGDW